MRLIDADKLKIYLSKYLHYDHAISWVDAQPTAYDINKVVEELKQQSEHYRQRGFEAESKGFSTLADKYYGKQCSYELAIEIVKQGGVDDDVCEWKYSGNVFISCNYKRFADLHSFEYCPYCGKKIKVVE